MLENPSFKNFTIRLIQSEWQNTLLVDLYYVISAFLAEWVFFHVVKCIY